MLVDSGECLGAQVTTLEQRTDEHFTDIASQLRKRAMTCVSERQQDKEDEHIEMVDNNLGSAVAQAVDLAINHKVVH